MNHEHADESTYCTDFLLDPLPTCTLAQLSDETMQSELSSIGLLMFQRILNPCHKVVAYYGAVKSLKIIIMKLVLKTSQRAVK